VRDAKFAALRGCNVNIMKQEKIMTFQMPKKHYVHQTAGGKWAVAVKHKSIFWYNPDELFDDKHDAHKQMLVEQMQALQSAMDAVWNTGLDAGHFNYSEDRGDYLC